MNVNVLPFNVLPFELGLPLAVSPEKIDAQTGKIRDRGAQHNRGTRGKIEDVGKPQSGCGKDHTQQASQ